MKPFAICLLLIFASSLSVGCASKGEIGCESVRPIFLTQNDAKVISDKLARQIVAHNEFFSDLKCQSFLR